MTKKIPHHQHEQWLYMQNKKNKKKKLSNAYKYISFKNIHLFSISRRYTRLTLTIDNRRFIVKNLFFFFFIFIFICFLFSRYSIPYEMGSYLGMDSTIPSKAASFNARFTLFTFLYIYIFTQQQIHLDNMYSTMQRIFSYIFFFPLPFPFTLKFSIHAFLFFFFFHCIPSINIPPNKCKHIVHGYQHSSYF